MDESRPPVLTGEGRYRVRERLERAREALAASQHRIDAGEAGAWETYDVAEHQRLTGLVEALGTVLAAAEDVASVDEDPRIVEVGDEVEVETSDGDTATYALVHPAEADPATGQVSAASPLGRALLGAAPGDVVRVDAPGGRYSCRVLRRRRLD